MKTKNFGGGAAPAAALVLVSCALSGAAYGQEEEVIELAPVEIRAPRIITPLPGVVMDRDQTTVNVQSATAEELREQQSVNVVDYLNTTGQSITINDYAGNPFQQDLNFRGFSASPLIGTPQGISVYLDGVRVNEPFGEVVNWDLIPTLAIERMDLIPGSSPLFGLNTLGGALSLQTKSGFTSRRFEVSRTQGSWGREQNQLAVGGNNGTVAGFLALSEFREDGWRDSSPSRVNQYFGRVDARIGMAELTGSILKVDNKLTGNGLVPYEDWQARPESVFTSPDVNENDLTHISLRSRFDIGKADSLSVGFYSRKMNQKTIGGDFWDDFDRLISGRLTCPDGVNNANGFGQDLTGPGCPGFPPTGLFNMTTTRQEALGTTVQWTHVSDRHQVVVGGTWDRSKMNYQQGQRLGFVDADRTVYLDPLRREDLDYVALDTEIRRNDLRGTSEAVALFATDTWTALDNLFVNYGLRWSRTRVRNTLESDRPISLYQMDTAYWNSRKQECGPLSDPRARFLCSEGDYTYYSTNPSFGLSWLAKPELNFFFNYSQGARTPSVIELGCARDREIQSAKNTGKNLGCSVPTSLSSDPYLPQVRSFSTEVGVRGTSFGGAVDWNLTVFNTDLQDDILFVSVGRKNRGVFDTFDATERKGFELGVTARLGKHTLRAAYTRLEARFDSTAKIVNQSNSSALQIQGVLNEFTIEPGDFIPGIPKDVLRLSWAYEVSDKFSLGVNMIAHAGSFSRGNENNEHQSGGNDNYAGSYDLAYTGVGRSYVGKGSSAGYAVFNFVGRYRITPQVTIFARVDNIFDKRYVTASELELNPFVAGRYGARDASGFNYNSLDWTHSQFVGPGAPRAGWIGVNYAFDTSVVN